MDRIEQDKLLEKILGKRQVWFDRTDVEKILNTLYSEPQVCPKPEQMMICPLADKCPKKKAKEHDYCCHKGQHPPCVSKFDKTCPACIPVPSTPAKKKQLGENNG